jgi:hypothetical protein
MLRRGRNGMKVCENQGSKFHSLYQLARNSVADYSLEDPSSSIENFLKVEMFTPLNFLNADRSPSGDNQTVMPGSIFSFKENSKSNRIRPLSHTGNKEQEK